MGVTQRRSSGKASDIIESNAHGPRSTEGLLRTTGFLVIFTIFCCSCIAYLCRSDQTLTKRDAYLKDLFYPLEGKKQPPLGDDGFYPIDALTEVWIATLRLQVPAEADKIRDRIKMNPVEVHARMHLCRTLEQIKQLNKSRSEQFDDFVQCYRRLMDVFAYTDSLNAKDSRRQVSRGKERCFAALAAGERLLAYCEDKPDRISDAVSFLHEGLGKGWRGVGRWCQPFQSCYEGYALLLLALRLQKSPLSELEAVLQEARMVPGPAIDWVDAMSVHRQLPGIRDQAFWDPSAVSWLPDLATKWHGMRNELEAYIGRVERVTGSFVWPHQPAEAYLSGVGHWNVVELSLDGQWGTACEAFASVCESMRGRQQLNRSNFRADLSPEVPPSTTVSIYQLLAGAKLRAHFGKPKRLMASLALWASEGSTIRVGAERRPWAEGHWIAFDDSYERDVINNSSDTLYVLQIAMLHPDVM